MKRSTVISSLAVLSVSVAALTDAQTGGTAPGLSEETLREVRVIAEREIRTEYPILLEQLALPVAKQEALLQWLIQDEMDQQWIAAYPWTEERPGRELSPAERLRQVAEIIGSAKAEELLKLERQRHVYAEAKKIETLLESNGAPISKDQRDKLLSLLITVEDQLPSPPAREDSVSYVENTIARLNERERHVLELAPGILSVAQVGYLFDHYEFRARSRLSSLEMQKKRRAEREGDDLPWHFPDF